MLCNAKYTATLILSSQPVARVRGTDRRAGPAGVCGQVYTDGFVL
jgi:hypothetical protein